MIWLELVWLGLLSVKLRSVRVTAREQLVLEAMD